MQRCDRNPPRLLVTKQALFLRATPCVGWSRRGAENRTLLGTFGYRRDVDLRDGGASPKPTSPSGYKAGALPWSYSGMAGGRGVEPRSRWFGATSEPSSPPMGLCREGRSRTCTSRLMRPSLYLLSYLPWGIRPELNRASPDSQTGALPLNDELRRPAQGSNLHPRLRKPPLLELPGHLSGWSGGVV